MKKRTSQKWTRLDKKIIFEGVSEGGERRREERKKEKREKKEGGEKKERRREEQEEEEKKEERRSVREFQKPKKSIDRSCRLRSAPAIVRSPSSRRQVRETDPFSFVYTYHENGRVSSAVARARARVCCSLRIHGPRGIA